MKEYCECKENRYNTIKAQTHYVINSVATDKQESETKLFCGKCEKEIKLPKLCPLINKPCIKEGCEMWGYVETVRGVSSVEGEWSRGYIGCKLKR